MRTVLAGGIGLCLALGVTLLAQKSNPSVRLEDHAWPDVEAHLQPDSVVVIPLGAGATAHGPHLKMRTDLTIAEYLARRIAESTPVVVTPPLTYHYDPAFPKQPGSSSLALQTARDQPVDVARSLARFGARRFYVLNASASAMRPLQAAAGALLPDGILLRYTQFDSALASAAVPLRQQPTSSHADEIETSLMLHVAPQAVDMARATGDGASDARMATAAKGATIADGLVKAILDDIARLRAEIPPAPNPAAASGQQPRSAAGGSPGAPARPDTCNAGDLRTIREVGDAYTYRWSIADADAFAGLWAPFGDIFHPDGMIERTPDVIRNNRRELFARREYRGSKHSVTLTMIRCMTYDTAVADGRWLLHGVHDSEGRDLPSYEGQVTMVLRRFDAAWKIEAYRYTMKAVATSPPPIWFKRPGIPPKK